MLVVGNPARVVREVAAEELLAKSPLVGDDHQDVPA
jgi:hypothetical protein